MGYGEALSSQASRNSIGLRWGEGGRRKEAGRPYLNITTFYQKSANKQAGGDIHTTIVSEAGGG